jgi:outer membrane protein assembly factor BamB
MKTVMALATAGMVVAAALGADRPLPWPQFRGPGGSGLAGGQKPPVEFGAEKNLRWKVPVPGGLSSPITAGENLVLTAFENGKLYTIAYRRADGSEAWRRAAPAKEIERFHKSEGSPAASTPATDGERIVVYFGSCGLLCYDLTGKEQWKVELPPAVIPGNFGSGTSPVIADGLVVLLRDELSDPRILAFDVVTGSPRWETKRQSRVSYCTPVVWATPDGKQVVAAGHGRMVGYDLKTGAEKWFMPGMPSGPCASPVAADGTLFFAGWSPGGPDDKSFQMPTFDALLKQADAEKEGVLSREKAQKTFAKDLFDAVDANRDGVVTRDEWDALLKFVAEGKNSAFALKPGGTGDVTRSSVLWSKTKGLPYISSGIAVGGQYVMVKDGGLVTAYDARTGREVYVQERAAAPGRYYASPVAANGNIYFTALDDGAVTVLKAGADRPEVIASNPGLGERVAATPALADNALYIRSEKHLYAFGNKK